MTTAPKWNTVRGEQALQRVAEMQEALAAAEVQLIADAERTIKALTELAAAQAAMRARKEAAGG